MMINIHARGCYLSRTRKNRVLTQLRLHFGRFAEKIARIEATLSDENGPKGGVDKRCKLKIDMDKHPAVLVQHKATSIQAALQNAVHKGKRSVVRAVDRQRKPLPVGQT